MNSIQIAIVLLSFCFIVILLYTLYAVFGGRLKAAALRRDCSTKSGLPVDYNVYNMPSAEKLVCILAAGAVLFTVGFIFYRSIVFSLLLLPLALKYPGIRTKEIIRKRKNELSLQFREALYSIAASLSAGKSIEAALRDAQQELSLQYPEEGTYIILELEQMNKRLEMNETMEQVLADFADRSHLEDILNFAEVFIICKRTGGNLVQVVKNTAEIISDKIDVRQEINLLLTEKKLEHKILNLMPVFIILMLSTSAEEFMAPVFTEPLGRAAMTLALLLFAAAYFISAKIMNIEV
jgi:tight adherence protein B